MRIPSFLRLKSHERPWYERQQRTRRLRAVALMVSLLAVSWAVRPSAATTVLVATANVNAGQSVTWSHVRSVQVKGDLGEHYVTDPTAIGQTLTQPLRTGELLGVAHLGHAARESSTPPGHVVTALTVKASSLSGVHAGSRVSVLYPPTASGPADPTLERGAEPTKDTAGQRQIRDCVVSSVPASATGGGLLSPASSTEAVVMVAIPESQVHKIRFEPATLLILP